MANLFSEGCSQYVLVNPVTSPAHAQRKSEQVLHSLRVKPNNSYTINFGGPGKGACLRANALTNGSCRSSSSSNSLRSRLRSSRVAAAVAVHTMYGKVAYIARDKTRQIKMRKKFQNGES